MRELPTPVVRVESLTVDYADRAGWTNVVDQVSFHISPGETLGLAGESGCGKSTTAYALLGYRPPGSRFSKGAVYFGRRDLLRLSETDLRAIRGSQISLVPQNPFAALNPSMTVGLQVMETLTAHRVCSGRKEAEERSLELFSKVGLANPGVAAQCYPHQLSGGQQQRVVLAMALACRPALLVLDEPTTGLDVTTQARILSLLTRLQAEHGMAMLYVSHNMAVLAQICHRLAVMYAGKLIEVAPVADLFRRPRHPYTRGLIAAALRVSGHAGSTIVLRGILRRDELPPGCRFAPRCDYALPECFASSQALVPIADDHQVACWRWASVATEDGTTAGARPEWGGALRPTPRFQPGLSEWREGPGAGPLLEVEGLDCAYRLSAALWQFPRPAPRPVVRDVSFSLAHQETFALVGESGSGKSTIARAIAGLLIPAGGRLLFHGRDITVSIHRRSREVRRQIQLVLQNPDTSLNPRHRVAHIIGRPLEFFRGISGVEQQSHVEQMLETVHLDRGYARRFPTELSGGERQRVAIARALAAEPKVLLCDEILSALDVSVQASILSLMRALQAEREISYLFISHDLAVVRSLAHRVGVLYKGQLCEIGSVQEVFSPPFHPYTEVLLQAILAPIPGRGFPSLIFSDSGSDAGEVSACPFALRCPRKVGAICDQVPPPWQVLSPTHAIRCHIPVTDLATLQASAQLPTSHHTASL